ncbi:MAG: class I SAM-dependent methyltransferase [Gammaproteobacteria bacterium]|nr:class I SAM-dependent methyltransferase [Gammaproteobacteria bacterium]
MDVILPYVTNRRVLDVGVVDSRRKVDDSRQRVRKPDALFQQISQNNAEVVGVDLDPEGVEELNTMGYKVHCGNAEDIVLDRTFDTIVAGEIIEHLDNPGAFLRNMKSHLDANGVVIVSTPNPFYCKQSGKIWRKHRPQVHEEHTCWFDPITLTELMRRQGLTVVDSCWVQPRGSWHKTWKQRFRGYFSHSFILVAQTGEPRH